MNARLIFLLFFLGACQRQNPIHSESLLGEWKADSLYNFDNGFGFTHSYLGTGQHYTFLENGKVSEEKDQLKREFLFELKDKDSLFFNTPDGKVMGRYQIIKLLSNQLVLKKNKKPMLPGKNQEMYQVLYLSRKK